MSEASSGSSSHLPHVDEPGDAELISAVRGGDIEAYGLLFERHVDAARRLARQLVSSGDADDLVSEAFAKVMGVLQRGGGPDLAFRAYLLTSLRRLHIDRIRARSKLHTTDDMTVFDPGVPFQDTAVAGFDNQAAAKAFAQLPERWQQVLWHTEVEGQKPAEIAPLLGMSANSVSALAYRAREGLRQAFISMHAQDAVDDSCATTRANLGAYIRNGISRRDAAKVEAHLKECRPCSAIYLELSEVNSNLGAVLAPLLLGSAAAGYLAASGLAAKGGVLLLLDRGKDWVLNNPAGRVTVGATAAGAVAAGVAVGLTVDRAPQVPTAKRPPATSPSTTASTTPPAAPPSAPPAAPTRPPTAPGPVAPPVSAPTASVPASVPAAVPASLPDSAPTTAPAPTNRAPQIVRPGFLVTSPAAGQPVVIDLSDVARDPDGDTLRVRSARVLSPSHGTVVKGGAPARAVHGFTGMRQLAPRSSTTITYTPEAGWRGTDTITYVLADDGGNTVTGRVKVTTPNAGPLAKDDEATVELAHPGPVETRIAVLGNDEDINADALTVSVVTQPASGRASAEVNADGTITYTSQGAVHAGFGDSFTYSVDDGHGGTDVATVRLRTTVTPPPPPTNRAPVADDDDADTAYEKAVTIDVLDGDTDPDGDGLSVVAFTQGAHGTVSRGSSGRDVLVYEPEAGFSGSDTFTYTVSDGRGGTDSATVRVEVQPVLPDAKDDVFTYKANCWYPVLANDEFGLGSDLKVVAVSGAEGGRTKHNASEVSYDPDGEFVGPVSFTYTVADRFGHQDTAKVTLNAGPNPCPPGN